MKFMDLALGLQVVMHLINFAVAIAQQKWVRLVHINFYPAFVIAWFIRKRCARTLQHIIQLVLFMKLSSTSFVFVWEAAFAETDADLYLTVLRWMYYSACFLLIGIQLFNSHWISCWVFWVPLHIIQYHLALYYALGAPEHS